jgi:hypothetical protein
VDGITHVLVASILKPSNLAAFTSPVITYAKFQMIQAKYEHMLKIQKNKWFRKLKGSTAHPSNLHMPHATPPHSQN